MTNTKISITILLLLLFINTNLFSQKADALPRSTPEAEGVSSEGISSFLKAIANSKHEFHSFMLLRHGKVVAEGWWNPYRADLKHTMYSASKSFTATAIGFAVSEHLLTVNDKVVSFFPNDLPDTVSPFLAQLTVKDVLSMSDGQDPDPTSIVPGRDSNWVKGFLSTPILNQPGTKFLYNSLGTYMLSAIVQKVTGQKVFDYLTPRLFKPLGITGIDWETDPRGINTGGWGLRLKTEDMAKFGQLFLQNGNWNGKQILPESWIKEASAKKIDQDPNAPQDKKDSNDWLQGYCYQMWRCRHNAYRGDGAFGQYIIVMPEKDAVLAITSESLDMQGELNLVWEYILPSMKDDKLAANSNGDAMLKQQEATLALPLPAKETAPGMSKEISDKTYTIAGNDKNIESVSFSFANETCVMNLKTNTGAYHIPFAQGQWAKDETNKYGPYLVARAKANRVGQSPFKIAGSYEWTDANTLKLILRYIESPHTETMICHFDNNKISAEIINSFEPNNKAVITGGY